MIRAGRDRIFACLDRVVATYTCLYFQRRVRKKSYCRIPWQPVSDQTEPGQLCLRTKPKLGPTRAEKMTSTLANSGSDLIYRTYSIPSETGALKTRWYPSTDDWLIPRGRQKGRLMTKYACAGSQVQPLLCVLKDGLQP